MTKKKKCYTCYMGKLRDLKQEVETIEELIIELTEKCINGKGSSNLDIVKFNNAYYAIRNASEILEKAIREITYNERY